MEYIFGLKTAVGSPSGVRRQSVDRRQQFSDQICSADSSFQIKSVLLTAVFRLKVFCQQQFSDQILDRRQQFSDACVLFGVQIISLRPI